MEINLKWKTVRGVLYLRIYYVTEVACNLFEGVVSNKLLAIFQQPREICLYKISNEWLIRY